MLRSPRNQTSLPSRNPLTIVQPSEPPPAASSQPYLLGIIGGALVGLFGAYIFKRAADEEPLGRRPVSNGQIFTIVMSSLTLIRQIAEMGKQPQKK